jgi:hypothetical protein
MTTDLAHNHTALAERRRAPSENPLANPHDLLISYPAEPMKTWPISTRKSQRTMIHRF